MYAQALDNFYVLNNASDGTTLSPIKLRDLAQHKDEQHMTSCVLAACQSAPSRCGPSHAYGVSIATFLYLSAIIKAIVL